MNRRTFLTAIGIGPVAAKALPAIPVVKPPPLSVDAIHQQAREWLAWTPEWVKPPILLPNQRKLFECGAPEILLTGGMGGGKTFAAREWLKEPGAAGRPTVYRGLYVDAANHTRYSPCPWPILETTAAGLGRKTCGIKFHRIVIDNAIEWESEAEYIGLMQQLMPAGAQVRPQIVVVATPRPNRPGSKWIRRRFIEESHPGVAVISLNIRDNPFLWSDTKYRAALEKHVPQELDGGWK